MTYRASVTWREKDKLVRSRFCARVCARMQSAERINEIRRHPVSLRLKGCGWTFYHSPFLIGYQLYPNKHQNPFSERFEAKPLTKGSDEGESGSRQDMTHPQGQCGQQWA